MRLSLPNEWNWSRFLHRVIELEHETGVLSAMLEKMRRQLIDELPDVVFQIKTTTANPSALDASFDSQL